MVKRIAGLELKGTVIERNLTKKSNSNAKEQCQGPKAYTTLITKSDGIITKTARLNCSGDIETDADQCWMCRGELQTLKLTLSEIIPLLKRLKYNNALVHGCCNKREAKIVTSTKDDVYREGCVARTLNFFIYPDEPCFVILDYDPAKSEKAITHKELMAKLATVFLEFGKISYVYRPSTSSCFYDAKTGAKLRGQRGIRVYLIVENPSEMKRFKEVLQKRMWINGLARIEIDKAGRSLKRHIIDTSVFSPERLDFCAGAYCQDKRLEQRLPDPILIRKERWSLDIEALPDLSEPEETKYQEIIASEMKRAASQAGKKRNEYKKKQVAIFSKRTDITLERAEEIATALLDGHLLGEMELQFDDLGTVSVQTVLSNPEKYDNETLRDPIEPEKGRNKAIFFSNDSNTGKPIVHSFLHGGQIYFPKNRGLSSTERLNQKYGMVLYKRQARIVQRVFNRGLGYWESKFTKLKELAEVYAHKYAIDCDGRTLKNTQGNPINAFTHWNKDPDKRFYDCAQFLPKGYSDGDDPSKLPDGAEYNEWLGFSRKAIKGSCKLIKGHMFWILCGGQRKYYRYLLNWLAYMIKHPELPAETMLVFAGEEGTGKNIIFEETIMPMLGCHARAVSSPEELAGKYNDHLAKAVFIYANEATWGGNKTQEGALKTRITDKRISSHEKFHSLEQTRNFAHIVLASNNEWATHVGLKDRRSIAFPVSEAKIGDNEYYAALRKEIDNGGVEALLYELAYKNISNFHPRNRPQQKSRQRLEMKLRGADPIYDFIFHMLSEAECTFFDKSTNEHIIIKYLPKELDNCVKIPRNDFYAAYVNFCSSDTQHKKRTISERKFFAQIRDKLRGIYIRESRPGEDQKASRPRVFEFSRLYDARQAFQELLGDDVIEWPEIKED